MRRFLWLMMVLHSGSLFAAPPGVLRLVAHVPMGETWRALHAALEARRFRVVFEARDALATAQGR